MKICLYSPYFPTHFGGGEKYLLDVAQVLATKHDVSIALAPHGEVIDESAVRQSYENFFQIDLSNIHLITTPLGTPKPWWDKLIWTSQWDCLYYLTDGSLFFSLARKNILHIQIPFTQPQVGLTARAKLSNWSIKNANSAFTKDVVEKAWKTTINEVHHPMIADTPKVTDQSLAQKETVILSVGRFFRQLHSKRQDVLVEMFKNLRQQHANALKGWKLVLVGGVEDQSYADEVQALAKGLPVEFHFELNRQQLIAQYQRAAIYWHAAGFEVNEQLHPEKVEHFGISTAEAMSHGAAPIVIGKGGQPEVVGEHLHNCLWQTASECLELTYGLISQPKELAKIQLAAYQRSTAFNRAAFSQVLWRMLDTT